MSKKEELDEFDKQNAQFSFRKKASVLLSDLRSSKETIDEEKKDIMTDPYLT